jgi:teichuronic acid biosynthesis glycosyltransferase TuaG
MIKFSVIIPVYNSQETIIQTLYSCINQTYPNYEILIIDDCSVDNTINIINDNFKLDKITIHRFEENKGVSSARNYGWDKATGDYITFLDSDDTWHIRKLEILSKILENPKIEFIGHDYTEFSNDFNLESTIKLENLNIAKLLIRNYFNTSCFIIKNSINLRFNESTRYTEDHDLLIRICEKHNIFYLTKKLTLLGRPQLSKGGLSGNKLKMRIGEMQMYINLCKRQNSYYLILPFLLTFSLTKHFFKILR